MIHSTDVRNAANVNTWRLFQLLCTFPALQSYIDERETILHTEQYYGRVKWLFYATVQSLMMCQ